MSFLKIALVFCVLFGSAVTYHWKHLKTFPTQIHAWAQCDYISISKGFQENNYNFFLPQQHNFNKQFENRDSTANSSKVTSADFPIVPYVNAIISASTGRPIFKTYRILTLLLSCIGLTFLFLIAYHYSSNYVSSIASVLLFSITPIYLDYQDSFLPSTPAISFLFIGVYYLIKYSDKKTNRSLILSFVFFSCSALVRFPFVIFLIAILLVELWESTHIKSFVKNRIIRSSLISILVVFSYFIYNSYLRNEFGSIFLASSLPVKSISEFFEILTEVKGRWGLHYFTICQYFILLFIIARGFSKLILNQTYYNLSKIDKVITISGFGALCYLLLMGNQLRHHDYYSLDTFYPILVLTSVISLSKLKTSVGIQFVKNGFLILAASVSLLQVNSIVKERRLLNPQDINQIIYSSYLQSDLYLSSLGISSEDNILVFDAFAPNMPLILMNRSGYSLRSCNKNNIENALKWDYNYIVTSNYYLFDKVLTVYPKIKSQIELVESNSKISVFKKSSSKGHTEDLLTFLKVSNKSKIIDNSDFKNWQNFKASDKNKEIGTIKKEQTYGPTFESEIHSGTLIYFSGYVSDFTKNNKTEIVVDISDENGNIFYKSVSIRSLETTGKYRRFIEFICPLPELNKSYKLKLYFYNPKQDHLNYSDLNLIVF